MNINIKNDIFKKDGYCLANVLGKTLEYFGYDIDISEISKIKNLFGLVFYLKKKNKLLYIYSTYLSFFSCVYYFYFIKL